MKIRTFIVGCALALGLFLFAQRHPTSAAPSGFHAVVDLSSSIDSQGQGTRIDAPAHLLPQLWTVDKIPTARLVAPLVVLDVSAIVANHPDYQVSVEDIANWEQAHGEIPLGSVVMARTGRAQNPTAISGYSEDAAKFLVEGRNALGLGIDAASLDRHPSKDSPVRRYILAHSVYQLQNVANLDRAPPVGGLVVVAPTKLENGSGGPVRILALVQ